MWIAQRWPGGAAAGSGGRQFAADGCNRGADCGDVARACLQTVVAGSCSDSRVRWDGQSRQGDELKRVVAGQGCVHGVQDVLDVVIFVEAAACDSIVVRRLRLRQPHVVKAVCCSGCMLLAVSVHCRQVCTLCRLTSLCQRIVCSCPRAPVPMPIVWPHDIACCGCSSSCPAWTSAVYSSLTAIELSTMTA